MVPFPYVPESDLDDGGLRSLVAISKSMNLSSCSRSSHWDRSSPARPMKRFTTHGLRVACDIGHLYFALISPEALGVDDCISSGKQYQGEHREAAETGCQRAAGSERSQKEHCSSISKALFRPVVMASIPLTAAHKALRARQIAIRRPPFWFRQAGG